MCLVAKKICKSNLIKGLKRKLEKKNPKKNSPIPMFGCQEKIINQI